MRNAVIAMLLVLVVFLSVCLSTSVMSARYSREVVLGCVKQLTEIVAGHTRAIQKTSDLVVSLVNLARSEQRALERLSDRLEAHIAEAAKPAPYWGPSPVWTNFFIDPAPIIPMTNWGWLITASQVSMITNSMYTNITVELGAERRGP